MPTAVPEITSVAPSRGVPGGEVTISCRGFQPGLPDAAKVMFGATEARIVSASADRVVARIPDGPPVLGVSLRAGGRESATFPLGVATRLATGLHPVTSPAATSRGSVVTTVSGARGQQVEHPLAEVTLSGSVTRYGCEILNPTGLAFGPDGQLYVSSRGTGIVYRWRDNRQLEVVAEDLGIACGLAYDSDGDLFVGDRAGTIHRIDPAGRRTEFVRLEPSISAYHLLFDPEGRLLVTGPTFSTRDALVRIDREGRVEMVVTGLGRPQGMARDADGNVLVTAAYRGRKGVFRLGPGGDLVHYVAAPTLVGLAAMPDGALVLADGASLYRLDSGTVAVV